MSDEKIDSYIDRDGVRGDTDFMLKNLNEVYEAFKRIDGVKLDLKGASGLAAIGPVLQQGKASAEDLISSSEKLITTQKKVTDTQRLLDKAVIEGKVEKQKYNAELKKEIELQNAANGSIEQARALIKNLTAERNKLNLSTEEGQKRLVELNAEIDKQNEFIKQNVDVLAKQKINIGNYEGSARIIVDALKQVGEEISTLKEKQASLQNLSKSNPIGFKLQGGKDSLDQVNAQLGIATQKFEALDAITSKPQFLNIASRVGDARNEIRGFTTSLIELEQKGLGSSDVAVELRQRLAQLTDQVQDTKAEIKALAFDTRGFDLFAGSVNFAADAFQTFAGAAQLAGASEKDAAKATATLVAIQSVSNGVKGIANELTTKGTAANKAYAFVQKQVNIVMLEGIKTANGLKAALGLLGIAATVIGGIAIALSFFSSSVSKAEKNQKNFNEALKEGGNEYAKAIEQVNTLRENIDLAKDGFIDKNDVVKQYNDTIGKTTGQVKNLDEAEQQLNKNAEAYISFMFAKATAAAAYAKAAQLAVDQQLKLDQGPSKEFKGLLESIKGDRGAQKYIEERKKLIKQTTQQEIDALLKFAQEQQKAAAETAKKFKFDFFGNTDENKGKGDSIGERRRKAAYDSQRILLETAAEIQKQIVDNEQVSFDFRIAALKEYVRIRTEIINQEAEFEKKKSGLTAEEINLINVKRDKLQKDLEAESFNKTGDIIRSKVQATKNGLLELTEEDQAVLDKLSEQHLSALDDTTKKTLGILTDAQKNAIAALEEQFEKAKLKELIKDTYVDGFQIAIDLSDKLLEGLFDRQKNRIQQQIDDIEKLKEADIQRITESGDSEENKANRIKIIEAKAQADREKLERRQRELDRSRAIASKAFTVFQTTVDGIQAINKARLEASFAKQRALIAPIIFGPAAALSQAILIQTIISAASAVAAAAAAPIPRFKHGKGKNNSYEGLAWVDDGGKPEAIIRESGSIEIGGSSPRLTHIGKKDVVLPDVNQLIDYVIAGNMGGRIAANNSVPLENSGIREIKSELHNVVKAIENIPQPIIHVENMLSRRVRRGDSTNTYLNNNLQG